MGKRMRDDDEDAGEKELCKAGMKLPSQIKNKQKRSAEYAKVRAEKIKEKKKRIKARDQAEKQAVELGEAPPARKVPRTIENTREADETVAQPDDEELQVDDGEDEFSGHFSREHPPKLLITTSQECSAPTRRFIKELLTVIPNATFYKRGSYELKQIVKYASNRGFTSMFVVNENRRQPNGLLIVALPEGPTAHFKLSSIQHSKNIKGHGKTTSHMPELILNNFTTRLGHRIGRLFSSVFPQDPQFRGRRAVTFHNQRDFIFFRHHRYIFEEKEIKELAPVTIGVNSDKKSRKTQSKKVKKNAVVARLQECGPRFTLKLQSLQSGTFDSKYGEYEWVHKPDMDTSRRRFFL